MQNLFKLLTLQFFGGEGASSGGDGGAGASGVSSGDSQGTADAGQNRETLESMGVPQKNIEKYRAFKEKLGQVTIKGDNGNNGNNGNQNNTQNPALRPFPQTRFDSNQQDAAAGENSDGAEAAGTKQSLKEALKGNSEWNREMQAMMAERVNKTNADRSDARALLNLFARDYGLEQDDPANLDLAALKEKAENDKNRYRKMAAELGTDTETAMKIDRTNRENAQLKAQQQKAKQQAALQEHYRNLQAQAQELKKTVPDFDLDRELNENREFYERTLPGGRDSVKSAYYALHGDEIVKGKVNQAVTGARQALANSSRSGRNMPQENGSVGRAASTTPPTLKYSQMNSQQRAQFLREAKAGRRFE